MTTGTCLVPPIGRHEVGHGKSHQRQKLGNNFSPCLLHKRATKMYYRKRWGFFRIIFYTRGQQFCCCWEFYFLWNHKFLNMLPVKTNTNIFNSTWGNQIFLTKIKVSISFANKIVCPNDIKTIAIFTIVSRNRSRCEGAGPDHNVRYLDTYLNYIQRHSTLQLHIAFFFLSYLSSVGWRRCLCSSAKSRSSIESLITSVQSPW